MFRTYVLPILAVCGLIFAIRSVVTASKPLPIAPPVAQPAQAPFQSFIAGSGLVEARNQNIAVGTPVPGIVTAVLVQVGSTVKTGEPLFTLDDRELQAELLVRRTALRTAQEQLTRLQRWPRAEDFPPVKARVKEAEVALADAKTQLAMAESVSDRRAVSQEEVSRRRYNMQGAAARLAAARAQLSILQAGTWKQDINVAKAEVAAAQAQVRAVETTIARLTIRAPMDGELLQVNIRPGEFASTGALQTPLVLLGNLTRLHVRVDVDENDAWRFQPHSAAVAFVRGNRDLQTPLRFERVEPYIVPKRSLSGESTERVDTRVLQILYSFERGSMPVYVGQQMDVFIETVASEPAATAVAAPVLPETTRGTP